jgi:hypothetical protein
VKVVVAGACSRAGKTAAAVSVLHACAPQSMVALKFTTTDDVFEKCPRGTPCLVCDIDVPYRLVTDEPTLRQSGTDTDRLAAAGARQVIWAIAKRNAGEAAWQKVAADAGHDLVIEGSTVVEWAAPDLLIFVVHPFLAIDRWKPTSGPLLRRADVVVVNRPAGEEREPAAEVMAEIARHRPAADARIADVTRPLAEWAPEWAERLIL